ncbi:MAG TPA: extracellular solute-binding protein, partial [Spirochaetia bacterium]|nr:extracellular solute-binding protein [Spirochaetia bacterium]
MIRKKVLLAASFFLLTGALAVWASGSSEKAASGPVTLTWWSPNFNDPNGTNLAQKYMQENPNVKVNVQETVATGLDQKILVALQSGSAPDVIDIQVGWTIPFAATGQLLALDSYIAKSKIVVPSDFFPANWNASKYDGKVYGIPYRAESHAFIYNKGMYSAAGLDPNSAPADWNQLLAYSQKLTNTSGSKPVYGVGVVGGGEVGNMIYNMVPWIW